MRLFHHSFTALLIACCVLGACSDDKPAATPIAPSATQPASGSAGAAATQPPAAPAGGDVDCTALRTNLADVTVNWQVVIGLSNSPSSEWAQIPLGSITKFGDQLAAVNTALGSDADAAAALAYMSGANDIVARGLGGDANAQADLTSYLGTDIAANVGKQLPLSIAYQTVGCK